MSWEKDPTAPKTRTFDLFFGPIPKEGWFTKGISKDGETVADSFFLDGEEFAFKNLLGSYTGCDGLFVVVGEKEVEEYARKKKLVAFE